MFDRGHRHRRSPGQTADLTVVDLLSYIFQYLSVADLLRCRATSSLWLDLADGKIPSETVVMLGRRCTELPAVELAFPCQWVRGVAFHPPQDGAQCISLVASTNDEDLLVFTTAFDPQCRTSKSRVLTTLASNHVNLVSVEGGIVVFQHKTTGDLSVFHCPTESRLSLPPGTTRCGVSRNGEILASVAGSVLTVKQNAVGSKMSASVRHVGLLDAEMVYCSAAAVVVQASTRRNTQLLSFRVDAGGVSFLQSVTLDRDEFRATLDGSTLYGVSCRQEQLWAWSVDTDHLRRMDVRCSAMKRNSSCLSLHLAVGGSLLLCQIKRPSVQSGVYRQEQITHEAVFITTDGSACRVLPIPTLSHIAIHPTLPLLVHTPASSVITRWHPLVEAVESGMAHVWCFGGPANEARSSNVANPGGMDAAAWIAYAVVSGALLWTVSAIVYNGWWVMLQRL